MTGKFNLDSDTSGREIVMTRVFDAPRELVFKAYTDPQHVKHWWGPNGFTNTILEMDVRPGGVWRFIMHGPDGAAYPNKIVYLEVVRPERLVFEHGDDKEGAEPSFHVIVTLAAQGNKTHLTLRMIFSTAAERDKTVKDYGAIEGGNQTMARLAEYLAKMV